jgi:ketosteroid isomerase-like protein
MRTRISTSVAAVLLLLAGCAPGIDVAQERAALMSTDREWSQTTGDPDKFVSFYAPDASFYSAGMPLVKGPAAIREVMGQLMTMPGFALQFSATNTQVSAAGDLGYITGTYELTLASGVEKGKYVTVWRKQPDGSWRVVEDIFNADAPPPAPPAEAPAVAPR